jgi:hypothetical protein
MHTVNVAPARDEDVGGSHSLLFHFMKTHYRDMALPLNQMQKRPQLCIAQMAVILTIQRNQDALKWGHMHSTVDQFTRKHKTRLAEQKLFCMKE